MSSKDPVMPSVLGVPRSVLSDTGKAERSRIEGSSTSILQEAEALIHGQRQTDYGDKRQNFSQIAMIWTGMLARKLAPEAKLTPDDVAILMIGMKAARLAKSPEHRDSWVDIAGYAACAERLQEERRIGKPLLGATEDAGASPSGF